MISHSFLSNTIPTRTSPPIPRPFIPEPGYVSHIVQVRKDNDLPPNIPYFMTEGNIRGGAGPSTVKSALWLADSVASMVAQAPGPLIISTTCRRRIIPAVFSCWIKDYNLRGYPPQYLRRWRSSPRSGCNRWMRLIGSSKPRATSQTQPGLRWLQPMLWSGRWSVVGHAGEPRPIQRSHREIHIANAEPSAISRVKSIASPSVPRSINGIKEAPEAPPTRRTTVKDDGFRRRRSQCRLRKLPSRC